MLVAGLAVMLRHEDVEKMVKNMKKNYLTVFMFGFVALIMGLLIVVSHNIWALDWPVAVTLIGWLVVLKGLVIIFFSGKYNHFQKIVSKTWMVFLMSGISFGLAILFGYIGWWL